jgi:hypothetical protein
MGLQFTAEQFEKITWDTRFESNAKLIALAVKSHINWRTRQACVSIPRLAYMCNCDQRTVRRYLPDIQRVLGIEIVPQDGKAHTFKLRVFETAQEIQSLFEQEEWRSSKWLVFKKAELGQVLDQMRAALTGEISGETIELPLSSNVPPTLDVPPTAVEADPPHPLHEPPSSSVRRTHNNSYINSYGAGAVSASAHKGVGSNPRAPKKTVPGFETFMTRYRAAMRAQSGSGNASIRADTMPDRKAKLLWDKFTPEDAAAAEAYIPALADKSRSFMPNANTYLEDKPWRRAAPLKKQEAAREIYLQILTTYRLKGEWPQEARDHWGAPPDKPGSSVPAELWQEAQERAKCGMNGAAGHA